MAQKIVFKTDDGVYGLRASGVLIHHSRVLLCRLVDDDIWVLPGGGINLHETSPESVKREFLEEGEFDIDVLRLLWIIENFFVLRASGEKMHGLEFYFLVSAKGSEGRWIQDEFYGQEDYWDNWKIVPGKTQPMIFKWFPLEELNKINLKPTILKELLKNLPEYPVHIQNRDY
ncbi:MAG: hypothetical protein AM326_01225 [Candidatus Thorarchaeota archaeon SMTZ-45]|nr:MAG: hypothetical protein AM326_01225 [Candidatus Thorarchaeota archaeon SMTZ-45]